IGREQIGSAAAVDTRRPASAEHELVVALAAVSGPAQARDELEAVEPEAADEILDGGKRHDPRALRDRARIRSGDDEARAGVRAEQTVVAGTAGDRGRDVGGDAEVVITPAARGDAVEAGVEIEHVVRAAAGQILDRGERDRAAAALDRARVRRVDV